MTLKLPEAQYPMITRVTTDRLFPVEAGSHLHKDEPIIWELGQRHPLLVEMSIARMFVVERGVEIYSTPNDDKKGGMRNLIPMRLIRLVEEVMPEHVFIEELEMAEAGEPVDEEDDEDDEGPPHHEAHPHPVSNGQPTT